jgi:deazaflavin-dependent oxidoreductase (nitroreductase family)
VSGQLRTNPAAYLRDGDRILVFASNAGLPKNPDWYHNLLADPQVTVEIGDRTLAARAVPLEGAERDRHYEIQATRDPGFRRYAESTTRTIPVIALHFLELSDPARNRAIGEQLIRHHDELRAELSRLRAGLDDDPTRSLLGHCLTFCHHLRLHHVREDGAFTAFEEHVPTLDLSRLRQEHQAVAQTLTRLQDLAAQPGSPAVRAELERLATDLEDHFDREEQQLLPLLGVAR